MLLLTLLMVGTIGAAQTAAPVAIIQDQSGMPGNLVKEGAHELAVLMQVAQIKNNSPDALGVVGVGNGHGLFSPGTQRALELVVQQGIPVVRLAQDGAPTAPATPDCLFIDGGGLTAEAASELLTACLAHFGPLPAHPGTAEWQAHYARYQDAFTRAVSAIEQAG